MKKQRRNVQVVNFKGEQKSLFTDEKCYYFDVCIGNKRCVVPVQVEKMLEKILRSKYQKEERYLEIIGKMVENHLSFSKNAKDIIAKGVYLK